MAWFDDPAPDAVQEFFQGRLLEDVRNVVIASGLDAASFLQGQCAQEIEGLEDGESTWSLLLEPDGKLSNLLWIERRGPETFALVPARHGSEAVVTRLARFRLRVKVELQVATMGWAATWKPQDGAGSTAWSLHESPSDRALDNMDDVTAWVGQILPDDVDQGLVPNELGSWLEHSVSFTKGCYTGQELVARIDARSAPPVSRLLRFRSDTEMGKGTELVASDAIAGVVVRSCWNPDASITHGLARIKRQWLPEIGSTSVIAGVELLG